MPRWYIWVAVSLMTYIVIVVLAGHFIFRDLPPHAAVELFLVVVLIIMPLAVAGVSTFLLLLLLGWMLCAG